MNASIRRPVPPTFSVAHSYLRAGSQRLAQAAHLLVVGLMLAASTGCARGFWREYADWEVYNLVRGATHDQRYALDDFTIAINPKSRLFDPTPADFPPLPPDDAEAHAKMHCVDCKRGYPCWHAQGHVRDVDYGRWRSFLPSTERGELLLNRRTAICTGLVHSREYQQRLETLYLSALDVTFERFRFDLQFFGGDSTFYQADGRLRNGTGDSATTLNTATRFQGRGLQVRKLTASGGSAVVGLANSLTWQFSGPNGYNANTLLDFTLIQPVLRAGGRARVLERLTRVERGLIANLRLMELYRRNFYIDLMTGAGSTAGPQRQGGLFGGSGLQNFSGVGAGGFGRVGGVTDVSGGGGGGAGGAGAARAGGFLGLLQATIEIRNREANVENLRESLAQLEAANDAGRIDRFQVDLARQNVLLQQSALLNAKVGYQTDLDTYKVQLGLPPTLTVEIRDKLLEPFQLISPRITALQRRLSDLLDALRDPTRAVSLESLGGDLEALAALRRETAGEVAAVEDDLETLRKAAPSRRERLARLASRPLGELGAVDPRLYDVAQFEVRLKALDDDFSRLSARHDATSAAIVALGREAPAEAAALRQQIVDLATTLAGELGDLSLAQARARLDAAVLEEVEVTPEQGYRLASQNRLDWMNARLGLVDSWRLVEFNANDLRSDLNLIFSGDIGTVDNNPVRFRSANGRLRVGVEFDAPLTRINERNVYRQSLIEYQQARRSYMAFRDRLMQSLRSRVRLINLNQLNFEIRRAAVLVAINQVEVTRLRLDQPPKAGETSSLSNTTARDLVDALNNLTTTQNDFLSVWVNFEVQRLGLDYDLGTMVLDEHGLWVDPGAIVYRPGEELSSGDCDPIALPPGMPSDDEFLEGSEAPDISSAEELPLPEDPIPSP